MSLTGRVSTSEPGRKARQQAIVGALASLNGKRKNTPRTQTAHDVAKNAVQFAQINEDIGGNDAIEAGGTGRSQPRGNVSLIQGSIAALAARRLQHLPGQIHAGQQAGVNVERIAHKAGATAEVEYLGPHSSQCSGRNCAAMLTQQGRKPVWHAVTEVLAQMAVKIAGEGIEGSAHIGLWCTGTGRAGPGL